MTVPTTQSSASDFDFFIGTWSVAHRRLKERLVGCTEWIEFKGTSVARKILWGLGNIDDNVLELPDGPYRAVTLRSFDIKAGTWSIWWLDGRNPGLLDVPVVGGFENGVGTFYADDALGGKPIRVRFRWTLSEPDMPRWDQAFSMDGGETWECNWVMDFSRVG